MPLLGLLLLYPLLFVLFWTPGLTGGWLLVRRLGLPSVFTLPLGLIAAGLAGYAFFWVYFFHPTAGAIVSMAWVILTLGWLASVVVWRGHPLRIALRDADVSGPLTLSAAVGLLYLALLYLYPVSWQPQEAVFPRAPALYLAIDNEIPMWFADRLERGEDPRAIVGNWRSSDRPPLQTGMVLALRSLVSITGLSVGVHYQLLGTVIQCGWVGVFWLLGRLMKVPSRQLAWTFAFVIVTSFFYWHSVYVWPKLLAGSLTLTALALVLPESGQTGRPSWGRIALAGVAAGLGMLSHGGVFFTLLAIAVYFLRPSLFPGLGRVALGTALLGLTMLPWMLYQKFYDPPGDRLVKWHLAGVIEPDERSALQALSDTYSTTPLARHLGARSANVLMLFGRPLTHHQHDFADDRAEEASRRRQEGEADAAVADRPWLPWLVRLRLALAPGDPEEVQFQIDRAHRRWINGQYYNFVRALGWLNLGWVVLLLKKHPLPGWDVTCHLLAVAWLGLGLWLLLMVEPGSTVVHHGSFATFMVFFLVLAALLAGLPRWGCVGLVGLLAVELLAVWITHTADPVPLSLPVAALATVAALAVGGILWRLGRGAAPPVQPATVF